MCVAVKCDPSGTFMLGGTTHDADCNTAQYAVVEVIDACPHNHPTNVASSEGWCTSRQANHIDLSCSALGGISSLGMNVGRDGWLNVDVQIVPCSLGLGLHSLWSHGLLTRPQSPVVRNRDGETPYTRRNTREKWSGSS
jgi:hypothetical protein